MRVEPIPNNPLQRLTVALFIVDEVYFHFINTLKASDSRKSLSSIALFAKSIEI